MDPWRFKVGIFYYLSPIWKIVIEFDVEELIVVLFNYRKSNDIKKEMCNPLEIQISFYFDQPKLILKDFIETRLKTKVLF